MIRKGFQLKSKRISWKSQRNPREKKQKRYHGNPIGFLSFAIVFVSLFLSSILLGTKRVFPKDKPQSASKFRDWPWFSIVWLLCGSSFVCSFPWWWTFSKSLSPFLYYSFGLLLCSILLASSPWFTWCSPMGVLWDVHHNSIKCP